jgi:hypothetical protein
MDVCVCVCLSLSLSLSLSLYVRLSAVAYPAERLQDLWFRKLNLYIGRKTDGSIWRSNKEEKNTTLDVHWKASITIRFPVGFS